ncbi:ATP-binding protein [Streptomyces flavofungini]|uniref:ATP-binding protein n=1 Tax=Streptomyces flavofungini TaxID=68200 RepID=UPI0025B1A9C9|nr:ATP-binding protein [Streptomyces flavofungini]WJV44303.1 ATP-binding protein [Streptomyces flavofungini]
MLRSPGEQRTYREWKRDAPTSAAQARELAREFMTAVGCHDERHRDAVLVVVSELVTNALRYAHGVTGFRLSRHDRGLTVSVHDAGTQPPRTVPLDPGSPGGFGLHLVRGLTEGGVRVEWRPGGKNVWATVPQPRAENP